ncbi:MAG: hypothetical protein RBU37_17855 [Myxococcota bacterium]|jgi:hypothetical protein|nr:hypothetical protein [Myxococcota bacterium]
MTPKRLAPSFKIPLAYQRPLALVLLLFTACGPSQRIEPLLQPPPELDELAQECSAANGDAAALLCLQALSRAVERGDAQAAGQTLLSLSRQVPPELQQPLRTAALWLNPSPWLVEHWPLQANALVSIDVPPRPPQDGKVLCFKGAQLPNIDCHPVDLPIPIAQHPLAGSQLARILAAAHGAPAAVHWNQEGKPVLSPATPLFDRILGFSIDGGLELGQADHLLRQGKRLEADQALRDLRQALPQDAAPCSTRAALEYLNYVVNNLTHADADTDLYQALDAIPKTHDDPNEANTCLYMAELWRLYSRNPSAESENAPPEWKTRRGRANDFARLWPLAEQFDGKRAALLRAYVKRAEAYNLEKEGDCDTAFETRRKRAIADSDLELAQLGQDHLSVWGRAASIIDDNGRLVPAELQAWLAWSERPENRWLRGRTYEALLAQTIGKPLIVLDRAPLAPLCERFYELLSDELRRDQSPLVNERNAARIGLGFQYASVCRQTRGDELLDLALAQAFTGEQKVENVFDILLSVGTAIALDMLYGRTAQGFASIARVSAGAQRFRKLLGTSDEERVLDTTLFLIESIPAILQNPLGSGALLEQALKNIENVAKRPADPSASLPVRLAPAISLLLRVARAGLATQEGFSLSMVERLSALDPLIRDDLQRLVINFGAPNHAETSAELASAWLAVALFVASPSQDSGESLLERLRTVAAPGEPQSGWWALGLDAGRFLALDVFALAAASNGLSALSDEASLEAERVWMRGVDTFIAERNAQGSHWELLDLGLVLNELIFVFILDDDSKECPLCSAAPKLARLLRQSLNSLDDAHRAGDQSRGLIDFALQSLQAIEQVGVVALIEGDEQAQQSLAEAMAKIAPTLDGLPRGFALLASASLLFPLDAQTAAQRFGDAEAAFVEAESAAELLPLMLLMSRQMAAQPESAAQTIDTLLERGHHALGCHQGHLVHAALPARAWLYQRDKKYEEAQLSLLQYLDLVSKGYSGEGRLTCKWTVQRGAFTMVVDLGQSVTGMAGLSPTNEGTFQLGIGFDSIERERELLNCTAEVLPAPRFDRIAAAQYALGAYAATGENLTLASNALENGRYTIHYLTNGSYATLREHASLLNESRESIDFEAQIQAQFAALGQALLWGGSRGLGQLFASRSLIAPERVQDRAPKQLSELGLDDWKGWGALAQLPADATGPSFDEALQAHLLSVPEAQRWAHTLVASFIMDSRQNSAKALSLLSEVRAPTGHPLAPLAIEAWSLFLQYRIDGSVDQARVLAVIEQYLLMGLHGEAVGFVEAFMNAAFRANHNELALTLGDALLQRIDTQQVSNTYAEFVANLLPVWRQMGAVEQYLQGAMWALPQLTGIYPFDIELNHLIELATVLAEQRATDVLRQHIERVVSLLLYAAPEHDTTYLIRGLALALEGLRGDETNTEALASQVRALLEQDAQAAMPQQVRDFLSQYIESLEQRQKRESVARAYIGMLLLGGTPY